MNSGPKSSMHRVGVLALFLFAWALLLFRLDEVPPGFQHDQTFTARDAMTVVSGRYPVYFPDNFGRGPLFMYTVAGVFRLIGEHFVWSVRFTAIIWGLIGLAASLSLARRYLSPGAALFATALMAGSFWYLLAARLGVESIALLSLAIAMVYWLDRGVREDSLRCFALAGLFGGVANYTYLASRTLYGLPVLLACYLAVSILRQRRRHSEQTDKLKRQFFGVALSLGVMVAVSGPLLLYISSHPGTSDGRIGQLGGALRAVAAGDFGPILRHTWDTGRSILWNGSAAIPYHYGIPGRPVLLPVYAALLLVGLGATVVRVREAHEFLFLAALFLGLAPDLLTGADALYMRAIYSLPLMFILVARGLWTAYHPLQTLLRRYGIARWPNGSAALPALVVGALLVWQASDNAVAYFKTWARAEPTQRIYNADFRAAAAFLARQPADIQAFIGTDRLIGLDTLTYDFYEPRGPEVTWYELPDAPPVPTAGEALYLLPEGAEMPYALERLEETIGREITIPAPSGSYKLMRGFWLSAGDLEQMLYESGSRALSEPLIFGDALRLDAAGLLDHGSYGELMTSWTVLGKWPDATPPGYPPVRPKFAVAITDDSGYKWSQADETGSLPFRSWRPGQKLLQITRVPLSPDMPPGNYSVQLVIYDDQQGVIPVRRNETRIATGAAVATVQLGMRLAAAMLEPAFPLKPPPGGPLQLLGKWEALDRIFTGIPMQAHLSWQAREPLKTRDLQFSLQARSAEGQILWEQKANPGGPLPETWPEGQVFRIAHPFEAQLAHDGTVEATLEVCAGYQGNPASCSALGPSQIVKRTPQMALSRQPENLSGANWENHISLAGYDLRWDGQTISLTLYWRAGTGLPASIKRFVHATGADGTIVAQTDQELQVDGIPVTLWLPGEYVLEEAVLQIPPDRQVTQIYVGLYALETGERLPVQLPSGVITDDGRVAIEQVPGD